MCQKAASHPIKKNKIEAVLGVAKKMGSVAMGHPPHCCPTHCIGGGVPWRWCTGILLKMMQTPMMPPLLYILLYPLLPQILPQLILSPFCPSSSPAPNTLAICQYCRNTDQSSIQDWGPAALPLWVLYALCHVCDTRSQLRYLRELWLGSKSLTGRAYYNYIPQTYMVEVLF